MKYWTARGMESCDLGGRFPPYKRKFGSRDVPIISVVASKYRALLAMRNLVKTGYRQRQRISERLGTLLDP
jgi:hypothetical protein